MGNKCSWFLPLWSLHFARKQTYSTKITVIIITIIIITASGIYCEEEAEFTLLVHNSYYGTGSQAEKVGS